METWDEDALQRLGIPEMGIVKAGGAGQSELAWYVRTRPAVRRAFSRVWGTDQLLTSFDGFNIFLPWQYGFQKTMAGWLHADQGHRKQGLHGVQGFVALNAQDASTGGFLVVPGSHHLHQTWVTDTTFGTANDFVRVLGGAARPLHYLPRRLVSCQPGDLVIWDSRCIHCNTPAVLQPRTPKGELLRMAVYVCMLPKKFATDENLRARQVAYKMGMSSNHWPLISAEELRRFNNGDGFCPKRLEEATDGREELIH